jgi:hypothetical protein
MVGRMRRLRHWNEHGVGCETPKMSSSESSSGDEDEREKDDDEKSSSSDSSSSSEDEDFLPGDEGDLDEATSGDEEPGDQAGDEGENNSSDESDDGKKYWTECWPSTGDRKRNPKSDYDKHGNKRESREKGLKIMDFTSVTHDAHRGIIAALEKKRKKKRDEETDSKLKATCLLTYPANHPLHSLEYVGIDTCSAMSVSTESEDFVFIDDSIEAKQSFSLRGIGGEQNVVGGRVPSVICTQDENLSRLYMVDPSGVYLDKESSSQLRILGQQRMKKFVGFDLVQNKSGDGKDFLVHRHRGNNYQTQTNIPLVTQNGIMLLQTFPANFTTKQKKDIRQYVMNMSDDQKEGMLFRVKIDKVRPVLIMNEGTLTDQEVLRLDHWRHAHRLTSGERHTERCPACEQQAKHKQGTFKQNAEYLGTGVATQVAYWRLYCDGFGGQHSMGDESYQGAKGDFVFVCPVSRLMKVKLYINQTVPGHSLSDSAGGGKRRIRG